MSSDVTASLSLARHRALLVRQRRELAELFGYETRNKYEIVDEQNQLVAYAAEQQKGFLGFLFRQFLGHWRTFDVQFFDGARRPFMVARHPFRFIFQRLEVFGNDGSSLGAIQQRFALFSKRFDVEDRQGQVMLTVSSPFWRIWTFPVFRNGQPVGAIKKRWSGLFSELMTDRDNFLVELTDPALNEVTRRLLLAAAIFVDLQYFERKAQ